MAFKLAIFDCDGVLIDSEVLACQVDADLYTSIGYPMTPQDVMDRFVGMSGADIDALIEQEIGREIPSDYDVAATERLFDLFRRELKATDGVFDLIDDLTSNGVRICVASSSSPRRLALTLDITGILPRVSPHVFSAAMVERGKPAPDLFLHAARALNTAPNDCLVIEDSAAGITAARAAGMQVVGFCGGSHCGPAHADKLRSAGASRVFATMADLRAFLPALRAEALGA